MRKSKSISSDFIEFDILWRDNIVASIKVNFITSKVDANQFVSDPVHKPFPIEPVTFDRVFSFIEERCFPYERYNRDQLLNDLGLDSYSPWLIVKKTHGVLAEDFMWIRFKGENLTFDDVKFPR